MERKNTTRKLVMGGLMIALSVVLSYVKVLRMPQGGSITAGSMVPIILFSLIFGLKDGLFASCIYGIIQFMLDGFVIYPASILMDYILGFGVMGFAGLFYSKTKNLKMALIGSFVGGVLRFIMLVLSGVLLWGEYAPEGVNVWKYSLGYNGAYMVPEIILTVVIVAIIYNKVYDAMK